MKATAIAAVLASVGCSSSSSSAPTLDGNWIYINTTDGSGVGLTFKGDSYVSSDLVLTSGNSANAQVETGTFVASGNTITFTPGEWSCPGPDAVYSLTYAFDGSDLDLAQPSATIVLQPNTATASASFAFAFGCFSSTGEFTTESIAPVSN